MPESGCVHTALPPVIEAARETMRPLELFLAEPAVNRNHTGRRAVAPGITLPAGQRRAAERPFQLG